MIEMMREALQTATNLYEKFEEDYLKGASSEAATAKWEASADQIAQIDKDLFSRDWRIKSSHRPGDSSLMPLDVPPKLYAVPPCRVTKSKLLQGKMKNYKERDINHDGNNIHTRR